MSDFLSRDEMDGLFDLEQVHPTALVSRRALILGGLRISLGAHARIDAFCVISAGPSGIVIGRNVHVAAHVTLMGVGRITLEDFSGLSVRVSIFTSNEDYLGDAMTNPCVPEAYRKMSAAPVRIGRHTIVGAGSVVLPGVSIGESSAVGALSLVRGDIPAGVIAAGTPVKVLGERGRGHLDLEAAYLRQAGPD